MSELLVRPALTNLAKPEPLQQRDDLAWLQDRPLPQGSSNLDRSHIDELGLKHRLPVFEKHLDHFAKVLLKLVQVRRLRVGTRPARDVTDKKARFRIAFNDELERSQDDTSVLIPSTVL